MDQQVRNISEQFSLFPKWRDEFCHGFSNGFFAYLMVEFIGVTTSETGSSESIAQGG